jgi:hypothetical protein
MDNTETSPTPAETTVEAEAKAEVETKMEAEAETEVKTQMGAEADVEVEAKTEAQAKTVAKTQRGRPFQSGESGNPKGRPKGSRNKATLAAEALLEAEAETITRKAVEKALEGNLPAIRLCLERLLPLRRERPVAFDLPKIEAPADVLAASSAVVAACAEGTLSPGEARDVMDLLAVHLRAVEQHDIETRLCALENAKKEEGR